MSVLTCMARSGPISGFFGRPAARWYLSSVRAALILLLVAGISGCGGGISSVAEQNKTFYAYDSASKDLIDSFESPYPSDQEILTAIRDRVRALLGGNRLPPAVSAPAGSV